MKPEVLNKIIHAGIAAPSADNSQPWLYNHTGDTIHLYIDETRSGKISDTRYLLSDIAIGCVIENMLIQARHLGYQGNIEYFPQTEKMSPLYAASINFTKQPNSDSIPDTSIYNRHTDRTFPWKGSINSEIKESISAETRKINGADLLWLDNKQRKIAYKALFLAESLRFSDRTFHQELFSSIDFNLNWKQSSAEGLAPAALNVEFFAKPIFKLARKWKFMKVLNLFGGAHFFGLRSTVIPSLLSPELCLVTINETDRKSIIASGRAIQRTWLKISDQKLNSHPFASPCVMSLNFFNCPHLNIPKISSHMSELSPNKNGVILFRVGTQQQNSQLSKRRRKHSFQRANQTVQE